MNARRMRSVLATFVFFPLASCSGLKNGSCGLGCASGDAHVSVTIFDTPPTGITVLSFSVPMLGISLTPSSGSAVSIYSPTAIVPTELTHLVTDSTVLATAAKVPAGTYTGINVTVGVSSGVFVNANPNQSTITWAGGSCVYGAICELPNGVAATVSIPLTLTLTANQNQWIGLDINLNNAITTSNGTTISIDFTQANIFAATTTPAVNLPAGTVDTTGDFVGIVTALTSSSITVSSGMTGQSTTAAIESATEIDDVPTNYTRRQLSRERPPSDLEPCCHS
jgi:hypothetical protein